MNDNAIGGIDIIWYLVKDAPRAIVFYRDVMELTPSWTGERGAEFELANGTTFGIWRDDTPWKAAHGVMFSVPDVRKAAAYYGARGAKITSEVVESPYCYSIFVEDTEGNEFILHERKVKR